MALTNVEIIESLKEKTKAMREIVQIEIIIKHFLKIKR